MDLSRLRRQQKAPRPELDLDQILAPYQGAVPEQIERPEPAQAESLAVRFTKAKRIRPQSSTAS